MKSFLYVSTGIALALLLSSCMNMPSAPNATYLEVRQAIEQTNDRFQAAFSAGDADSLVALFYADDARLLPPDSPMLTTRQEILDFWTGFVETSTWRDLELTMVNLDLDGNMAYEIGTYQVNFRMTGSDLMNERGKYLVVWKRQPGGLWKAVADIWNSLSP